MVWRQGKYTVTRDQWGLPPLVPGDTAVTCLERESLVEKLALRRLYPLWKYTACPKLPYVLNLLSSDLLLVMPTGITQQESGCGPQGQRPGQGEGREVGSLGLQRQDPQQTLFFLHPDFIYFLFFYIYTLCVWFSHLKLFLFIIKRGRTTKKL